MNHNRREQGAKWGSYLGVSRQGIAIHIYVSSYTSMTVVMAVAVSAGVDGILRTASLQSRVRFTSCMLIGIVASTILLVVRMLNFMIMIIFVMLYLT